MNEMKIGKAGEYLTCHDLIMNGYDAFLSDQGLPFDVIAINNNNLIKIQVKSSITEKNNKIIYNIRHGKGGQRGSYSKNDVDIIAFVNLINKKIAYIPLNECKSIIEFYTSKNNHFEVLEKNMNLALDEIKKGVSNLKYLSDKYNLSINTLSKYKNKDVYKTHRNYNYFENFTFNEALLKLQKTKGVV